MQKHCVGLLKHRMLLTQPAQFAAVLLLIFLGSFPRVCGPPAARRTKRTLLFFLVVQKIVHCTREDVATALAVIEIQRGTGMWPSNTSSPVFRKISPIIYLKGAVTRVNKILCINVFIDGERGFLQEWSTTLDKLNNSLRSVCLIMHLADSSELCPSSLFPSLHCCAVEVSEQLRWASWFLRAYFHSSPKHIAAFYSDFSWLPPLSDPLWGFNNLNSQ